MRAPFQILAIPYKYQNGIPMYCVLHRSDYDQWQFIATEIAVVCGSNKKMKKRLDKEFSLDERICVYGYAEQAWELLSGTDVYLTKPGGLSTSEAKAMGVPMVLLNMLGACEKYNAAFFSEIEGAVFCESAAEAAQECLRLLENDSKREKMRDNLLERNRMIPTEFIASVLAGNKYVKE